jgi:hypothetical protein
MSVSLRTGSFNQWSTSLLEMTHTGDGVYALTLLMRRGKRYAYQFVVTNGDGEMWHTDPRALLHPDTTPFKNSLIDLTRSVKHVVGVKDVRALLGALLARTEEVKGNAEQARVLLDSLCDSALIAASSDLDRAAICERRADLHAEIDASAATLTSALEAEKVVADDMLRQLIREADDGAPCAVCLRDRLTAQFGTAPFAMVNASSLLLESTGDECIAVLHAPAPLTPDDVLIFGVPPPGSWAVAGPGGSFCFRVGLRSDRFPGASDALRRYLMVSVKDRLRVSAFLEMEGPPTWWQERLSSVQLPVYIQADDQLDALTFTVSVDLSSFRLPLGSAWKLRIQVNLGSEALNAGSLTFPATSRHEHSSRCNHTSVLLEQRDMYFPSLTEFAEDLDSGFCSTVELSPRIILSLMHVAISGIDYLRMLVAAGASGSVAQKVLSYCFSILLHADLATALPRLGVFFTASDFDVPRLCGFCCLTQGFSLMR